MGSGPDICVGALILGFPLFFLRKEIPRFSFSLSMAQVYSGWLHGATLVGYMELKMRGRRYPCHA
jgi:hypothetical protein